MKQTKRQRIEQLEAQIREKDRKITRLEDLLANHEMRFVNMQKTMDSTPSDCKPGEYCRACHFGKAYSMYDRQFCNTRTLYLCNKAGACENFVQKEVEDQ